MSLFWIIIIVFLLIAWVFCLFPFARNLKTGREPAVFFFIAALMALLAFGIYFHQGSSAGLQQRLAFEQRAVHLQILLESIRHDPSAAIRMMETYLKQHPGDKHAAYLLAKLYQVEK